MSRYRREQPAADSFSFLAPLSFGHCPPVVTCSFPFSGDQRDAASETLPATSEGKRPQSLIIKDTPVQRTGKPAASEFP